MLLLLEFFTTIIIILPLLFKLLVCITIAGYLFFANENRSRYASFWVESIPIFVVVGFGGFLISFNCIIKFDMVFIIFQYSKVENQCLI